jgi:hypothetical protein
MAVALKNAAFWGIKSHTVPNRGHIISLLQSQAGLCYVRFEVFMAMTKKNAIWWGIKPSSYLTGDTLTLCYKSKPVNTM